MLLCLLGAGAPVRLPVQDVFKGRTGGTCVGGKLEAGALKPGSKVLVVPGYVTATVKGLEVNSQVCVWVMDRTPLWAGAYFLEGICSIRHPMAVPLLQNIARTFEHGLLMFVECSMIARHATTPSPTSASMHVGQDL